MAKDRRLNIGDVLAWWALLLIGGLFLARPVLAGGWATVTLTELPLPVPAGEPLTVHFAVRQHGQRLLPGLAPQVVAEHDATGARVTAPATADAETGYYAATLILPQAGAWRWHIEAFSWQYPMPPLQVLAPTAATARDAAGPPPPVGVAAWLPVATVVAAALAVAGAWRLPGRRRWLGAAGAGLLVLAALSWLGQGQATPAVTAGAGNAMAGAGGAALPGEALFVAKGCIQCHRHDGVTLAETLVDLGPNLTDYRGSRAFLRQWLANPAAVRADTQMPDLALNPVEIETLVAFLGAAEE